MIEMLGVLAIIGVLSVGGIAGYSKAMTKFKINKTIDFVSQTVANIQTLYKSQGDYNGLVCAEYSSAICSKAKIIPEEFFNSGTLKNPFDGGITIAGVGLYTENDRKAFYISLSGIPVDACMELVTLDWKAASATGLVAIATNDENISNTYSGCSGLARSTGVIACVDGTQVSVPIPVSTAVTACNADNNTIKFKFY